jgi:uncharacterized protein
MCSLAELQNIINSVVKAYRDVFGSEMTEVLLYGSYARGDYEADSDIDLVAIVHGERKALQEKLKLIWDVSADLELEHGIIISPTVIPYDEYMKYKEDIPYYKNISLEGVKISV